MIKHTRTELIAAMLCFMGLGLAAGTALAGGAAEPEPSAGERIAQLKAMCNEAAPDIEARQAERSLYERLGGREAIHALTDEIVRLHLENDDIKHIFEGVDTSRLSDQVTDFMVVGYGGQGEYTGRDMTTTHAHLGITDADFLSAGGDIEQALENLGHGEEETQEVVCSLMPFHEQVVSR